jgi:hypothetical protein
MEGMQSVDRDFSLDTVALLNTPLKPAKSNLSSLASVWARRYVASVAQASMSEWSSAQRLRSEIVDRQLSHRRSVEARLSATIRHASAQAWAKTEALLQGELDRHGIAPELINPWEIAGDAHQLFAQVIAAYGANVLAPKMALTVGPQCGQLRTKYMAHDPRIIGFVSMQCHYTGQMLLAQLRSAEQQEFAPYLKVIDDHLYMPLQEAYQAAAQCDPDDAALRAVQNLLRVSSRVARKVCKRVQNQNLGYQSYSGLLSTDAVRVSSLRDVEMFQLYLCLCLLEGNVRSVQAQLFPLCVMLYPRLRVSWNLVQEMLEVMGWEMHKRLLPGDMIQFLPYLRTLGHMFSKDVFEGSREA